MHAFLHASLVFIVLTAAKPANLRGHSRRYVPGSSVSMPSGHGRLHNSCQVIPEETELARDQAVGTRAQTTRKCPCTWP